MRIDFQIVGDEGRREDGAPDLHQDRQKDVEKIPYSWKYCQGIKFGWLVILKANRESEFTSCLTKQPHFITTNVWLYGTQINSTHIQMYREGFFFYKYAWYM